MFKKSYQQLGRYEWHYVVLVQVSAEGHQNFDLDEMINPSTKCAEEGKPLSFDQQHDLKVRKVLNPRGKVLTGGRYFIFDSRYFHKKSRYFAEKSPDFLAIFCSIFNPIYRIRVHLAISRDVAEKSAMFVTEEKRQ